MRIRSMPEDSCTPGGFSEHISSAFRGYVHFLTHFILNFVLFGHWENTFVFLPLFETELLVGLNTQTVC